MSEVEANGNDVLYIGANVHERETQLAVFEPGENQAELRFETEI